MSVNAISRWRSLAGVLLKDYGRYRRALRAHDAAYLGICNRSEVLELAPSGQGYRCNWQWTSDLHAPKYLPALGLGLMKRALDAHPILRTGGPGDQMDQPKISFIIGHRGIDRLPQLLATLESIAGQRDVSFECLVVEQSAIPEIRDQLPEWVRYVHTPLPYAEMPYSRAWAFNCGARAAQAAAFVLHDNDMLAPVDYAKEIIGRLEDGYEVVNLKRFIFYLSDAHSAAVLAGTEHLEQRAPAVVVQNLEAGGSIAITRSAYFAIGGLDESFVGWGGEDNEFWERAGTRRVWPYAYMPIVHLWHAPQTGKLTSERSTAKLYEERSSTPAGERIAELVARDFGNPRAPYGCLHEQRA